MYRNLASYTKRDSSGKRQTYVWAIALFKAVRDR